MKNFWISSIIGGNLTSAVGVTQLLLIGQSDFREGSPANPAQTDVAFLSQLIFELQINAIQNPSTGGIYRVPWWLMKATSVEMAYMTTNGVSPLDATWTNDDNVQGVRVLHTGTPPAAQMDTSTVGNADFNSMLKFRKNLKGKYPFKGAQQLYWVGLRQQLQGLTFGGGSVLSSTGSYRARCLSL